MANKRPRSPALEGKTVGIFVDFSFEDMEVCRAVQRRAHFLGLKTWVAPCRSVAACEAMTRLLGQVMYPKMRLEEEGCVVLAIGSHAAGMAYKAPTCTPL